MCNNSYYCINNSSFDISCWRCYSYLHISSLVWICGHMWSIYLFCLRSDFIIFAYFYNIYSSYKNSYIFYNKWWRLWNLWYSCHWSSSKCIIQSYIPTRSKTYFFLLSKCYNFCSTNICLNIQDLKVKLKNMNCKMKKNIIRRRTGNINLKYQKS